MTHPDGDRRVASAPSEHDTAVIPPGADPRTRGAASEPHDDIVTPAHGDVPADDRPAAVPADAAALRGRWHDIQSGFVDDPRAAVAAAGDLVHEAVRTAGEGDTEALRQALRGYHMVLESLLGR